MYTAGGSQAFRDSWLLWHQVITPAPSPKARTTLMVHRLKPSLVGSHASQQGYLTRPRTFTVTDYHSDLGGSIKRQHTCKQATSDWESRVLPRETHTDPTSVVSRVFIGKYLSQSKIAKTRFEARLQSAWAGQYATLKPHFTYLNHTTATWRNTVHSWP